MGGMAAGICLLLVMAFSSQAMEAASQAARVFAGGVMPALLPMMVLCRLLPAHANHERSAWRGYAGAVFFSFASGPPQRSSDDSVKIFVNIKKIIFTPLSAHAFSKYGFTFFLIPSSSSELIEFTCPTPNTVSLTVNFLKSRKHIS